MCPSSPIKMMTRAESAGSKQWRKYCKSHQSSHRSGNVIWMRSLNTIRLMVSRNKRKTSVMRKCLAKIKTLTNWIPSSLKQLMLYKTVMSQSLHPSNTRQRRERLCATAVSPNSKRMWSKWSKNVSNSKQKERAGSPRRKRKGKRSNEWPDSRNLLRSIRQLMGQVSLKIRQLVMHLLPHRNLTWSFDKTNERHSNLIKRY